MSDALRSDFAASYRALALTLGVSSLVIEPLLRATLQALTAARIEGEREGLERAAKVIEEATALVSELDHKRGAHEGVDLTRVWKARSRLVTALALTTIDSAYRSPEEDAAYFASIWGLSPAKMQVLEKAFRDHERNAPPRTAVEGVRRLIQPNIMLTASEVHVDGFERKAVFNALTYLTRTGELAHAGYGKYQAPPADFVPESPKMTTIDAGKALEIIRDIARTTALQHRADGKRVLADRIDAALAAFPPSRVEGEPVDGFKRSDFADAASELRSGHESIRASADRNVILAALDRAASPSPVLADEGMAADKARLDWLEMQDVMVVTPGRSRSEFWATVIGEFDGPFAPSDLRAQIDRARSTLPAVTP